MVSPSTISESNCLTSQVNPASLSPASWPSGLGPGVESESINYSRETVVSIRQPVHLETSSRRQRTPVSVSPAVVLPPYLICSFNRSPPPLATASTSLSTSTSAPQNIHYSLLDPYYYLPIRDGCSKASAGGRQDIQTRGRRHRPL